MKSVLFAPIFLLLQNLWWHSSYSVTVIFQVTYDATGFLEKNRDTLSADIIQVLRESSE